MSVDRQAGKSKYSQTYKRRIASSIQDANCAKNETIACPSIRHAPMPRDKLANPADPVHERGKGTTMSPAITALFVLIVFLTSTLSGVFGMAGGMVLLAALLAILPVATAIAVQGAIQIIANGSRAWFSREFIDWRIIATMVAGIAVAAAVLFAIRYQPDLATVCIAIGLMPLLVWIPKSWLQLDASRPFQGFAAGLISGGLNLAVGVAGPSIDVFFIRTQMDRRKIIATKACIQVISHGVKVVFYGTAGAAMVVGDWLLVAIAAPFAVAGTNAGYLILQRLSDDGFRRWTRWIVTLLGIFYLTRGIFLLAAP